MEPNDGIFINSSKTNLNNYLSDMKNGIANIYSQIYLLSFKFLNHLKDFNQSNDWYTYNNVVNKNNNIDFDSFFIPIGITNTADSEIVKIIKNKFMNNTSTVVFVTKFNNTFQVIPSISIRGMTEKLNNKMISLQNKAKLMNNFLLLNLQITENIILQYDNILKNIRLMSLVIPSFRVLNYLLYNSKVNIYQFDFPAIQDLIDILIDDNNLLSSSAKPT